jgi:hypothetical protein
MKPRFLLAVLITIAVVSAITSYILVKVFFGPMYQGLALGLCVSASGIAAGCVMHCVIQRRKRPDYSVSAILAGLVAAAIFAVTFLVAGSLSLADQSSAMLGLAKFLPPAAGLVGIVYGAGLGQTG